MDLLATESAARDTARLCGAEFNERRPGKVTLARGEGPAVEIDFTADEVYRAVDALSREETLLDLGGEVHVVVRVAPLEVVWAMRAYTVGFHRGNLERAVRDANFYESLCLDRNSKILELADLVRLKSLRTWDAWLRAQDAASS